MKSQGGISYSNAAVAACPKHLLQFAVDQRYDDYTSVDHAVWRFIMRQNMFFLKEYAHKVYFQGLLNTGISFERIPRIEEMNDILAKIEWGAVAVDGFIPPAAFMEFQAYKVLVIACDMRQIHHIEYTPAPDIVHEAAGHAPIIVDREYSNYFKSGQTSFQTGVDKSNYVKALTFASLPTALCLLKNLSLTLHCKIRNHEKTFQH